jgi:hypothetical protein
MGDYGPVRGACSAFVAFGCADSLASTIVSPGKALQHESNLVGAGLADRRLRFAQGLGRDLGGDCPVGQSDAQGGARLILGHLDGIEFGGIERETNLQPGGGKRAGERHRALA